MYISQVLLLLYTAVLWGSGEVSDCRMMICGGIDPHSMIIRKLFLLSQTSRKLGGGGNGVF